MIKMMFGLLASSEKQGWHAPAAAIRISRLREFIEFAP
jgi:hypothetical protein